MYTKINISLPPDVAARVDKERGDVPRSRFVLRALERALNVGVKKKD